MIGREFQCRWFAWTLLALASAAIGPLQAGPLEVPNRFQGGTQARADQMNANFDAVDAAVDEQVSLNSVFLWSDSLGGATCVDLAGAPGHAGNEINSAVTVETLNAEEVGIPADMSGALSVGI